MRPPRLFAWFLGFALCLVSAAIVGGCKGERGSSTAASMEKMERIVETNMLLYFSSDRGLSTDQAKGVVDRIRLLKPGMTPPEVLQQLNLSVFPALSWASGPPDTYDLCFPLGTNTCMVLQYDMVRQPPTLLYAGLWNPMSVSGESNKWVEPTADGAVSSASRAASQVGGGSP